MPNADWTPRVINLKDMAHQNGQWLDHGGQRNTLGIVLHATAGGSAGGAISTLRAKKLSYDFIIDKDGTIIKCVPFNSHTSHAGISVGWKGVQCNRYTTGIAFVNENDGRPITKEQEAAIRWLIKTQIRPNLPACKYLTTHYGVSYPRKNDPISVNARAIAEDTGLIYWPGRRKD